MRITKVYTRTGDAGQTRLAGGQQVWKDCLRVEAYGTVDETNAQIGMVRIHLAGASPEVDVMLLRIQTRAAAHANRTRTIAFCLACPMQHRHAA